MSITLEQKIEAILLFKNEPISLTALSKILGVPRENIDSAISKLQRSHEGRGIVIVSNGEEISFGTHPNLSSLIEEIQKEELSRDIGRAGLETLSIILYKGPISRREIDYIRGVNSNFILRNLLIRGLIERVDSTTGERSFSYKATTELLRFLGITKIEELPEFKTAFEKLNTFAKTEGKEQDE
ncbi:SMC-Scp complex subunit ScpB [Candidatus Parcubacteria bacterium]|nr:SMC-Scp complex subunit ScpB [Candidatus Parcubacteria bacterium]